MASSNPLHIRHKTSIRKASHPTKAAVEAGMGSHIRIKGQDSYPPQWSIAHANP
jgi:hypothetical protein